MGEILLKGGEEVLICFAVFLAFLVKGLAGFANTLVFTSILSFSSGNAAITPVDLLLGYPANLIMAWKERRSIEWKQLLLLSGLMAAGSIPGMFFLKLGDVRFLKVLFGIVVILVALVLLLGELDRLNVPKHPGLMAVVGVLSGLLCGLFGIGALMGAYLSATAKDPSQFKGTISGVFLVENTLRILFYIPLGLLTGEVFFRSLRLMPIMVLGLGLGMFLSRKADQRRFKLAVDGLLMLSGLSLLVTNLI